ncbi:MAG TPA: hypothetical protein VLB04_13040, partial [Methanotrichaceae archaeon]|nr:hypothetical protein [Methanotrichaceae archaeon]
NTAMPYNVTLHPEVEDNESSWYYVDIMFDNDTRAAIGVTAYKSWQCADYPCIWWENMYLRAAKDAGEIQNGSASEATIDGKDGYIIRQEILNSTTNRVVNSTIAEYWVDAEEIEGYGLMAAKTDVEMISLLPENLTKDLLNTIHIEVKSQSSTLMTMSYEGDPMITVRDQTDADPTGVVIIPDVVSQGPAYVAVLDQAGDVLGYQSVADGVNKNVEVTLNSTPSSQWLYATLNKGGAVRSPWWKYPFVPDADYTSSVFLEPRAVSIDRRGGQAWLDAESSTQPIINGQPNPNYSREKCMAQLKSDGYPQSMASFYCD